MLWQVWQVYRAPQSYTQLDKKEHEQGATPEAKVDVTATQQTTAPATTDAPAAPASTNNTYQTYKNPYFMAIPQQENSNTKKIFDKISAR